MRVTQHYIPNLHNEMWVEVASGYYFWSNYGRIMRAMPGPGTRPGYLLQPFPFYGKDTPKHVTLSVEGRLFSVDVECMTYIIFGKDVHKPD